MKPSDTALQIAARCWCDKETETRTMDIELAVAFAKRLDILINSLKEGEYVLAGSQAIEGQSDEDLTRREDALMKFLETLGNINKM